MPILLICFYGLGGAAMLWQAMENVGRAVAYHRAGDWPNFSRRCLVTVAETMIGVIGIAGAILRTMRYCGSV